MPPRKIKVEKPDDQEASTSQATADTPVSGESLSPEEIELRIIALCQENPKGVSDKILATDMPNVEPRQRAAAINILLSKGQLDLFRDNKELVYKLKDASGSAKIKGADVEEKVVYSIIEEAGNKGIWARDIRYKSNLSLTQLNKTLKSLEGKKLIKAVTSVSAAKKKVYMLFNLEPDRSVTGGAWYSEQDFESEFVDVLHQQCYRFLQEKAETAKKLLGGPMTVRNASFATSKDIWKFITDLGISKIQLSLEDIEMILDTLVFDGKVEKSIAGTNQIYRAVNPLIESAGLVRVPCGVCPVIHSCSDVGAVQPKTCTYYSEWLE